MAAKEIKATSKKLDPRVISINYDLGDDLDSAVAKVGKEVVYSNYAANVIITIQSGIRTLGEKGKSDQQIQAIYDGWKPGIARVRTIDTDSLIKRFDTMSDEKQDDLLNKLKALRDKKLAAAGR